MPSRLKPQNWLAQPQTWLDGHQAWLAGPHALLPGPQDWLAGPEGTNEQMDKQQSLKRYVVSGSRCPNSFFSRVAKSNGAVALKGPMTLLLCYHTTIETQQKNNKLVNK